MEDEVTIPYTPQKLRSHGCFPEEPGEFHAQEAAECHQEGEETHQVLARGAGYMYYRPISGPKLCE
jgi:hypothetical protein